MKLFRFGEPGSERPGVILSSTTSQERIDISTFGEDYNERFFESGGLRRLSQWLSENNSSCPRVTANVRIASPIARPSKIICIGLNYRDHAEETKAQIPKEPVIFMKATTALCGPFDNLIIPKGSRKTDWEVELAVVIGKKATYISEGEASQYIAGYCLHCDYSEREFQKEHGGQWVKGKSADTFGPLGPFLATADEIADPHNLPMWLSVNGETRQCSNTGNMIFKIPFLISYVSGFMTLLPGDVISTGTPAGVGLAMIPPTFLKPGDIVELGIENLGDSRQTAVAYTPSD